MLLRHGTTRLRAEAILRDGPNPRYAEGQGGNRQVADGFSTAKAQGQFGFGNPRDSARRKDRLFPNEGGPVILEIELPDDLAKWIVGSTRNPMQGGKASNYGQEINFDIGYGIEELLRVWPRLTKRLIDLESE